MLLLLAGTTGDCPWILIVPLTFATVVPPQLVAGVGVEPLEPLYEDANRCCVRAYPYWSCCWYGCPPP